MTEMQGMLRETFSALVYMGDEHLAQEVAERMRKHFKGIPLRLEFESSVRRVLSEAQAKLPDLVILAAGSATEEIRSLIFQLQSVSGATRILLLGTSAPGVDDVLFMGVPIVRWESLLDLIAGCIPEQLVSRYGLERMKSPERVAVEEFALQFRRASATQRKEAPESLVLAPYSLMMKSDVRNTLGPESKSLPLTTSPVVSPRYSLSEDSRRHALILESGVLVLFLGVAAILNWGLEQEGGAPWLSLRTLSLVLAGAAVIGFLGSRAFERVFFGEPE